MARQEACRTDDILHLMIYADNTPNHSTCPDCGGDASDKERPESGWFLCQCGNEFEKEHDDGS